LLSCNTIGYSIGNYTISAYATPVQNETDVGDNTYTDGVLTVTDTTAPSVVVLSPENKTYNTDSVPLTLIINETASWIGYSLDGLTNMTISGNMTLVNLQNGSHSITIYANDTAGNMGTSGTICFTMNLPPPDVAVTNVMPLKTVVGQAYAMGINVTVENQADRTVPFNVSCCVDTVSIGTITNITLTSGRLTITFIWNTFAFSKGNYTLSASVWPIPEEVDLSDNNSSGGWVIVAMVGDITGPSGYPDGKIDARDVAGICSRFGAKPPDEKYDVNWDITGPTPGLADGNIDARDVSLVSSRYGQKDP
jgi:hypothetical protein